MHCALMLKGRHHQLVSTSTAVPCSQRTVTDMEPQNVSHSLKSLSTTTNKSCQTQTLETVNHRWYL